MPSVFHQDAETKMLFHYGKVIGRLNIEVAELFPIHGIHKEIGD